MAESAFGIEELVGLVKYVEEKKEWLEFVEIFLEKESWLTD